MAKRTATEVLEHDYRADAKKPDYLKILRQDAQTLQDMVNKRVKRQRKWEVKYGVKPGILSSFEQKTERIKKRMSSGETNIMERGFNDPSGTKFTMKGVSDKDLLDHIHNLKVYALAQTSNFKQYKEIMINQPKRQLGEILYGSATIGMKKVTTEDVRNFWDNVHKTQEFTGADGSTSVIHNIIYKGVGSNDILLALQSVIEENTEYKNVDSIEWDKIKTIAEELSKYSTADKDDVAKDIAQRVMKGEKVDEEPEDDEEEELPFL